MGLSASILLDPGLSRDGSGFLGIDLKKSPTFAGWIT